MPFGFAQESLRQGDDFTDTGFDSGDVDFESYDDDINSVDV